MAEREHEDFTTWTMVEIAGQISACQYEMSRAYRYEDLSKDFAERSGKAFAKRQDDHAKLFRELSDEFKKEEEIQRKTRHKDFSNLNDRLFAELDRRAKLDVK